jgi:hypothetical protein
LSATACLNDIKTSSIYSLSDSKIHINSTTSNLAPSNQFYLTDFILITTILPFYTTTILFKMQFFSTLLVAATGLASMASANSLKLVNSDSTDRYVVITAQAGLQEYDPVYVPGNSNVTQEFADGWIGNIYSYNDGAENVPGILGEFRWNGYASQTYYDVSAIVAPDVTDGVMLIYPADSKSPISGCITYSCDKQYNAADDTQTQATPDSDLIVVLGQRITVPRRGLNHVVERSFVLS